MIRIQPTEDTGRDRLKIYESFIGHPELAEVTVSAGQISFLTVAIKEGAVSYDAVVQSCCTSVARK